MDRQATAEKLVAMAKSLVANIDEDYERNEFFHRVVQGLADQYRYWTVKKSLHDDKYDRMGQRRFEVVIEPESGRGKIVLKYKQFDDGKWVIDLEPVNGPRGVKGVRESGSTSQHFRKVLRPFGNMISAWMSSGLE
jgi:hypothetical protein